MRIYYAVIGVLLIAFGLGQMLILRGAWWYSIAILGGLSFLALALADYLRQRRAEQAHPADGLEE